MLFSIPEKLLFGDLFCIMNMMFVFLLEISICGYLAVRTVKGCQKNVRNIMAVS